MEISDIVRGLKSVFHGIQAQNDKFDDEQLAEEIYSAQINNISFNTVTLLQIHQLKR